MARGANRNLGRARLPLRVAADHRPGAAGEPYAVATVRLPAMRGAERLLARRTYDRVMAQWPIVVEGEGNRPPPIGHDVESGLLLARGPEVVAWGSVEGIPWLIQAFVTAPGPDGKWWEHGPVGPVLEFALGKDGWFGGGEAGTLLNEGTHLTASIHFFGSHPDIVAWVGVVSDEISRVEVHLDDGDARTIEPNRGPPGFPRLFWFFPPRGAVGHVLALAADGRELQREDRVDADVHPRGNVGTSVNAFGYPAGRPPPGWPDDPAEYAPGEGPRHAEDLHLHEATFPLYVVAPDRWEGYAGRAGSGTSGALLDRVSFGYFDEPGGSRRGFEIGNERPGRRPPLERPPRPEDVGIWWSEPLPDDVTVNFAARFLSPEDRRGLAGDRGWPEIGPVRVAAIVELDVAGHRVEAVTREYRRLPQLRSIRFDLPDVHLALHGWNLTFDELEQYAGAVERLVLGSDLFRAMEEAEARTKQRFDELHGHDSGDEPNGG
jgi:hypothetical protein